MASPGFSPPRSGFCPSLLFSLPAVRRFIVFLGFVSAILAVPMLPCFFPSLLYLLALWGLWFGPACILGHLGRHRFLLALAHGVVLASPRASRTLGLGLASFSFLVAAGVIPSTQPLHSFAQALLRLLRNGASRGRFPGARAATAAAPPFAAVSECDVGDERGLGPCSSRARSLRDRIRVPRRQWQAFGRRQRHPLRWREVEGAGMDGP